MKIRFSNYKYSYALYGLVKKLNKYFHWNYTSFDMLHGKSKYHKGEDTYFLIEVTK